MPKMVQEVVRGECQCPICHNFGESLIALSSKGGKDWLSDYRSDVEVSTPKLTPVVINLAFCMYLMYAFPMFIEVLRNIEVYETWSKLGVVSLLEYFHNYIAPIFLIFLGMSTMIKLKEFVDAKDKVLGMISIDEPKNMERYNELKYCDFCDKIFDDDYGLESADNVGLQKMIVNRN